MNLVSILRLYCNIVRSRYSGKIKHSLAAVFSGTLETQPNAIFLKFKITIPDRGGNLRERGVHQGGANETIARIGNGLPQFSHLLHL